MLRDCILLDADGPQQFRYERNPRGLRQFRDPLGNLLLFGGEGYDSAGTDVILNDLWR